MRKLMTLLVMVIAIAAVGAQDWSETPTYGDLELEAGFLPDPYIVDVIAGGEQDATSVGYYGFVANAPDVDLYYEAGAFGLTIYVRNAGGDTLLLVNAPDGNWYFNDDTNGLDPEIFFANPPSGLYNIWVGTFDGDYVDAELAISER